MRTTAAEPRFFLDAWADLRDEVLRHRDVLLGLDYDGTLAPIVQRPELAMLPPETREVLEQLSTVPGLEIIVLSGRYLEDLKERVGIPGLTYGGNHGFEIERRGSVWRHPEVDAARETMAEVQSALQPVVDSVLGAQLDQKRATLSIHYRRVKKPQEAQRLKTSVRGVLAPWLERGDVRVTGGKMVIEVRPRAEWGKGHAMVALIRGEWPPAVDRVVLQDKRYRGSADGRPVFYIGDDQTDEDAFEALFDIGITVKVGSPHVPTAAHYYLRSPPDVQEFLSTLASDISDRDRGA